MLAAIQKWGDIQGIPLTTALLEKAQIFIGDQVSITVKKGQIFIKTANNEPVENQYEHISFNENNVPIISGTNMKVVELITEKIAYGWSAEELQFQHPYLTLGQIYSALAYYSDNKEKIDKDIEQRLEFVKQVQQSQASSPLVEKLKKKGLI
ncbi:DUF433 domain-containing protein [Candidatus Marithrix sp. Canyon 246]|uniref:DUF433 domain-containing protein n=1 Tax=Candidatus Marithrix sp. Canyon 246 TaxID=1827136 RepID=UPI0009F38344|nr:DUF433 domain-containing protein [Candidatus Marithrix sp. Canyon 246]